MAVEPVAAVPVKRFGVAKRRLAPSVSTAERSRLGRDLAAHTIATIAEAGPEPMVLAADDEVDSWARAMGVRSLVDENGGLDSAAAAATRQAHAQGLPWLVIHADLPLLTSSDIAIAAATLAGARPVVAPAKDGGTSLIGGFGPMSFAYGPGSFHSHLRRLADPVVLVRLGLTLDLDDELDLTICSRHNRGAWLNEYFDSR